MQNLVTIIKAKINFIAIVFWLLIAKSSIGQATTSDLKIDTTITGFHFAADYQGTYVFTLNGKEDLKKRPSAFSFTIMNKANYETTLSQIRYYLQMSMRDGYDFENIVVKDTSINGNRAYYISLLETKKGTDYKNYVFHAFYIKDSTAVLFISGDLDNGKYIESFKKTFYSSKL